MEGIYGQKCFGCGLLFPSVSEMQFHQLSCSGIENSDCLVGKDDGNEDRNGNRKMDSIAQKGAELTAILSIAFGFSDSDFGENHLVWAVVGV